MNNKHLTFEERSIIEDLLAGELFALLFFFHQRTTLEFSYQENNLYINQKNGMLKFNIPTSII